MHITCVWPPTKEADTHFLELFVRGVNACGDQVAVHKTGEMLHIDPRTDAVVLFAGWKPPLWPARDWARKVGKPVVYLDRGYMREKLSFNPGLTRSPKQIHTRITIGATQPTELVGRWGKPDDRRKMFNWHPVPWRTRGDDVVIVWSGGAYHEGAGLASPDDTAAILVDQLKRITKRPILYRPKPKRPFRHIAGVKISEPGVLLEQDLANAHVMITIGGSSCVNALFVGIPSIILGDGVTKWLSSTNIHEVDSPRLAPVEDITQFLNDLAYCQWTLEECTDGTAWGLVRERILGRQP